MKGSELKILTILLLELMKSCLEEDTDNATLTISTREGFECIADITFATRRKDDKE